MKNINWKKRVLTCTMAGVFTLLGAGQTQAADKALIVGVGHYQMSSINLPGIDIDVGMAKEIASYLGISESNTKVLMDDQASEANVRQVLSGWLTQNVSSDDRVFIYFSSHGTQVPDENSDETDGKDEAIVLYDASRESSKGLYIDDVFGEDIKRIPSRHVIIMVDACHSGTGTKALQMGSNSFNVMNGKRKFVQLFNPGSFNKNYNLPPTRGKKSLEVTAVTDGASGNGDNYVAFAAAQDDEQSIATASKGSLFTLAFSDAFKTARGNSTSSITLANVFRDTQQTLSNSGVSFHPVVSGNIAIADESVAVRDNTGGSSGNGPVWNQVASLVDNSLTLTAPAVAKEGDAVSFSVDVPAEGYLNIVMVGPKDDAMVLFPNERHQDNHVSPGQLTVPTAKMNFRIKARAPYGKTLVAAFLTRERVNLFEEGFGNLDSSGKSVQVFAHLTRGGVKAMRSYAVDAPDSAFWSGKATSDTQRK